MAFKRTVEYYWRLPVLAMTINKKNEFTWEGSCCFHDEEVEFMLTELDKFTYNTTIQNQASLALSKYEKYNIT